MSCTCSECKKKYKIDIIISDDLWLIINKKEGGLLCPLCIMKKLLLYLDYTAFKLIEIKELCVESTQP